MIGEKVAVGPGRVTWLEYVDHGQTYSACYLRGDLVRCNGTGPYIHEGHDMRRAPLNERDLLAIRECRPGPEAPPVWPPQAALFPASDHTDEDEEPAGSTWDEIPVGDIVAGIQAGTITKPLPAVGARTDGAALFYSGRVNGLISESGNGKTWVALHVVSQELAAGHHVAFIDYEDRIEGIVGRLLQLGANPTGVTERFHYIAPQEAFSLGAAWIVNLLARDHPTLVVIDSTGESMAVDGINPNDDDKVAKWHRRLPRWIAGNGPAVLTLDHVAKSPEGRGLYAIGSQRKRAAIDGASYIIETIKEAGIGEIGRAKLTVSKDRLGTYVRGTKAAEFVLDATSDPIDASLIAPAVDRSTTWHPTALMEKVSRYVEIHPGCSKNDIETAKLGKKAEYVRDAIAVLTDEGWMTATKDGRAVRHHSVTPYREADNSPSDRTETA